MRLSLASDGRVRRGEPLARHSSFKIGGSALYFAEPRTRGGLAELIHLAGGEGVPWILIGNASNVLFSDEGFDGLVLCLKKFELGRLSREGTKVVCSAGLGLIQLAYFLADHGLGGLEFVSTIPGTVGGALVMNAGYSRHAGHLSEIKDWVEEVKILDPVGDVRTLKRDEILFGYRSSSLVGEVVVEASLKLEQATRADVWRELKANLVYREGVQPLRYPSAGSVFKNPQGHELTAGKLIDLAGLRGLAVGDAQISEKHGNFIINLGRARAREVLELIAIAQDKVREKFGVGLELEVKCIPDAMLASSN